MFFKIIYSNCYKLCSEEHTHKHIVYVLKSLRISNIVIKIDIKTLSLIAKELIEPESLILPLDIKYENISLLLVVFTLVININFLVSLAAVLK